MIPAPQSEACLTAEICTPGVDGLAPVLVWVPGGSYRIGAASLPTVRRRAPRGGRRRGRRTQLPARRPRLARRRRGCRRTSGCATCAPRSSGCAATSPRSAEIPIASCSWGSRLVRAASRTSLAASRRRTGRRGDPPERRTRGHPRRRVGHVGRGAVPRRRRRVVGRRLATRHRGAAGRAGADRRGRAGEGRHDAVPSLGRRRPAPRAPHRAEFPAIPLVVGTTAEEMELFRDQVPALPDDIAVMFLAGKAAALGITDEARVRAALDACGGDLVEAVADLELHLPNELLARAHAARQPGLSLPVQLGGAGPARLPRARPPLHVRNARRQHWREFAGATGDERADTLSTRMQEAWTSFASTARRATRRSARGPRANCRSRGRRPDRRRRRRPPAAIWLGEP